MSQKITLPQARIPLGWATVGGQRVAVEIDEEWMRALRTLVDRTGGVMGADFGTDSPSLSAMPTADADLGQSFTQALQAADDLSPPAIPYVPTTTTTSSDMPIGSIVQAPYNIADPNFLPCDGRKLVRSAYPELSNCLPSVGAFASTPRSRTGVPTSTAIANDGTSWVVTSAVGVTNLYTTTNGIAYTARTTPAAWNTRALVWTGVNFVAVGPVGNALYSPTGATWTQSASASMQGVAGMMPTSMAYAPGLGGANGRICMLTGTSGATASYTSDDHGVTWTARGIAAVGTPFSICWTGAQYIILTSNVNDIATSPDGITWTLQGLEFFTTINTATAGSIVSDGNGKVLWIDADAGLGKVYTSVDHGATWSQRCFAAISPTTGSPSIIVFPANSTASYTNGRFFLTGASGSNLHTYASADLTGWALLDRTKAASMTTAATFSYKAGTYLCNASNAANGVATYTEDTTLMSLPYANQMPVVGSTWNNFQPFIKVQ